MTFVCKNNVKQCLLLVSSSTNLYCLCQNNQKYNWLNYILDTLNDHTLNKLRKESCYELLYYVGTHPEYDTIYKNVLRSIGLSQLPLLDVSTSFAIQKALNLSNQQILGLQRYFSVTTGSPILLSEKRIKTKMGNTF